MNRYLSQSVLPLLLSILAAGLTATPTWAADPSCPETTNTTPMVGVFTGRFADGVPVYRLPPIVVVADRKAELAKMEREEQQARAKQARARTARPPA